MDIFNVILGALGLSIGDLIQIFVTIIQTLVSVGLGV